MSERHLVMRVELQMTTHFWHFVMGELFPSLWHAITGGYKRLTIYHPTRKWGKCPLDRFYADISSSTLQIGCTNTLETGVTLRRLEPCDRWDPWKPFLSKHSAHMNPNTRRKVRVVVKFLKERCREYCDRNKIPIPIADCIVQRRLDNTDLREYYRSATGICKKYGAERRNREPLMRRIEGFLTKRGLVLNRNAKDGTHFLVQMSAYIGSKSAILAHGAGMVWLLFVPEGSPIIEISPPGKRVDRNPNGVAKTMKGRMKRVYTKEGVCVMRAVRKTSVRLGIVPCPESTRLSMDVNS